MYWLIKFNLDDQHFLLVEVDEPAPAGGAALAGWLPIWLLRPVLLFRKLCRTSARL